MRNATYTLARSAYYVQERFHPCARQSGARKLCIISPARVARSANSCSVSTCECAARVRWPLVKPSRSVEKKIRPNPQISSQRSSFLKILTLPNTAALSVFQLYMCITHIRDPVRLSLGMCNHLCFFNKRYYLY